MSREDKKTFGNRRAMKRLSISAALRGKYIAEEVRKATAVSV
jgi:hypothetical protein